MLKGGGENKARGSLEIQEKLGVLMKRRNNPNITRNAHKDLKFD